MITISEDKISANQSLIPNKSTENPLTNTVSISLRGNTGSANNTFVLKDPYIDEITLKITITQWKSMSMSESLTAQTFNWKKLQESVILYEDPQGDYTLSATCQIVDTQLKITYKIIGNNSTMDPLLFKFESQTTIRGANIVDDLTFQDGTMQISSLINYQEEIYIGSSQTYTFPHNCIAKVKQRSGGSSGWTSWTETFAVYKKGSTVNSSSTQETKIYTYLVFKNPED